MRIRDQSGIQCGLLFRTYFRPPYNGPYSVALQIALSYSQKGFRQIFGDTFPTASTRMDYVEIPLQTYISYTSWTYIPFLHAGIFYERLVRLEQSLPNFIPKGHEIYSYKEGADRKKWPRPTYWPRYRA